MKQMLTEEEKLIQENEDNYFLFEQMDTIQVNPCDDDLINALIAYMQSDTEEYYPVRSTIARYNVVVHNHQSTLRLMGGN